MTRQRRLKQRARAYMRATGTRFSTAKAAVAAGISRSDGSVPPTLEPTPMTTSTNPDPDSTNPDPDRGFRAADKASLTGVRPFFIVTSMQASVEYYRDRLGFEPQLTAGDFFAVVQRDAVAIHLKQIADDVVPAPNHTRHEWARHDAFVNTADPDALFAELVERGATIHRHLEDTDDGLRAFEARDLDGYVLCFGRPR